MRISHKLSRASLAPFALVVLVSAALGSLALRGGVNAQDPEDPSVPRNVRITFDLKPTEPRPDEVLAPPVDQDSSFPPPGPPIPPGPRVLVDSHFWDRGGTLKELEELEELEELSAVESLPNIAAAAIPIVHGEVEGFWRAAGTTGGPGEVAIHAALVRSTAVDAQILYFTGDAHTPAENINRRVDRTSVFKIIEPAANRFSVDKLCSPFIGSEFVDLFCSGHAQLGDGRLLVAGGTNRFEHANNGDPRPDRNPIHLRHFTAVNSSFIFDPLRSPTNCPSTRMMTNKWSQSYPMNPEPKENFDLGEKGGGRWYPTLLTLNSNQVLALWGHPADDDSRHTNTTPEIFRPESPAWQILGRESDVEREIKLSRRVPPDTLGYPRVHLLPNGRVFRATAIEGFNAEINPIPQSLTDRNDISVRVSKAPGKGYRSGDTSYTSVLLPLTPDEKYQARILLTGGEQPQLIQLGTSIPSTEEQKKLPQWSETGQRDSAMIGKPRLHANATILPTGEVFVSGGKYGDSLAQSRVLEGEIYNPFEKDPEKQWRTVAPSEVPREYHSVALLMPDGRVWHAGTSIDSGRGFSLQERRIDIYEPWYYTATRPVIRSMAGPRDPIYSRDRNVPVMHLHDSGVTVVVDHFRPVKKFALVRAGSVTHAFNSDQRYIELQSELVMLESLRREPHPILRHTFRLTSPPSSSIAPPGNYMLFAIDGRGGLFDGSRGGVPSVGRFIRIDRQFVGELKQEAEEFTSRSRTGVSVSDDRTTVFLRAIASNPIEPRDPEDPFEVELFPLLEYGGIDFGTEMGVVTRFSARLSSRSLPRDTGPGIFVVTLDKPDGPVIATLRVSFTDGEFVEQATSVASVSGVHDVFVRFTPRLQFGGSARVTVDWFKFK